MAKVRKKKRIRRVSPGIAVYDPAYPGNPVTTVLHKLYNQGKLDLPLDERIFLADRIAEGLAEEITVTSYGAAIIRRLDNWIKGRMRDDVL